MKFSAALGPLFFAVFAVTSAGATDWFPVDATKIDPPFSGLGNKSMDFSYVPLQKASNPWKLCASFPHMKDAYWLGVDYGLVEEAKRLGVKLSVVEAGGYTEISKQISQIEDCAASGVDAILIGAISTDGLNPVIAQISKKKIPIIDIVNGVSSTDITARSLVSYYPMGAQIGAYLAKKHPAGSPEVTVGWFPGPAGAAFVEAANKGFMDAIRGSAVKVVQAKYGDTGKEVQQKLVEDALQADPNIRYIAGTGVAAEAAQGVVRERGLRGKVEILSFYMSPGVFDGIKRGSILAAPADSMVVQARIAVDQAVRILEKSDYVKDVAAKIMLIDHANIGTVKRENILPPEGFKPVFN